MTESGYQRMAMEPLPEKPGEIPLSQLAPGQQAIIMRVGGKGPARRRYMEMGLVRGETIEVMRVAPLGDPVEYQVMGYRLSLRRADAGLILVRPATAEGDG